MNRFSTRLLGASAAALLVASPALANREDKAFLSQQHDKIAVARAEPGMAMNGASDLDRADAVLAPLYKDFSGNDRKALPSISSQIDAIIGTARAHNRIAAMKTEVAQLQARSDGRLASAEMNAAAAQRSAAQAQTSAAASKAENAKLRGQLSEYKMTQTQMGATLVLSDVSFMAGRSDLKSGAVERLRPLATYLEANPTVRVHIDGHTDGQGSETSNQALSDRRANAVRNDLTSMGVAMGRMDAVGHGEGMPVADNATAGGRQQNRRVEVTLVGQDANRFTPQ